MRHKPTLHAAIAVPSPCREPKITQSGTNPLCEPLGADRPKLHGPSSILRRSCGARRPSRGAPRGAGGVHHPSPGSHRPTGAGQRARGGGRLWFRGGIRWWYCGSGRACIESHAFRCGQPKFQTYNCLAKRVDPSQWSGCLPAVWGPLHYIVPQSQPHPSCWGASAVVSDDCQCRPRWVSDTGIARVRQFSLYPACRAGGGGSMASPLPEDIKSKLDSIGAHKKRVSEIGNRLTGIIEQTELQLRTSGAYYEAFAELEGNFLDEVVGWWKAQRGDWNLWVFTPGNDVDLTNPKTWQRALAAHASLGDKVDVIKALPKLLAEIERQARLDCAKYDSMVDGVDLAEGV